MTKTTLAGTGCRTEIRQTGARWMVRGSSLAIALGLGMGAPAQAAPGKGGVVPKVAPRFDPGQAVQGTPTLPASVSWGARTANSDTINVDTTAAIINWTTLDTATLADTTDYVNFLPEGTSLNFRGPATDFVVLNRVFSTPDSGGSYRGIAINGQVASTLIDGTTRAGQIWFYSPGGILAGSGATFNVGALVLTTSDVDTITGGRIDFLGAPQDFSSVYIDAGASISLTNEGSYFAVVAPTIEQHGTVRVNGSTTYFVTDSGAILLDGLGGLSAQVTDTDFDPLTIEGAAADGNFLVHTGTTGGVASLQVQDVNGNVLSADPHFIEFLAPNSAVTIEISGSVGYDAAAVAATGANGSIIIRGTDGSFFGLPSDVESPASSLTVTGTDFTSGTSIFGFNEASIVAGAGETITLGTDGWGALNLDVEANSILIGAAAGGSLSIDGNLTIYDGRLDRPGTFALSALSDPAGILTPGSVSVGGDLRIDTRFFGVGSPIQPETSDSISITVADGASLSVGGQLDLITSTYSTIIQDVSPYQASEVHSGKVTLFVGEGATLTVAGEATIRTDAGFGEGSYSYGSTSTAGDVDIDFNGAQVSIGNLTISSTAYGSSGSYPNLPGVSYDGVGGSITIDILGGTADLGSVDIDASGDGGIGGTSSQSGTGTGGDVSLTNTGALSVTDLTIVTEGRGGDGRNASFSGIGGSGGTGQGGAIVVDTSSTITGLTSIYLSATGTGGRGGAGYYGSGPYPGGVGGDGFGGSIRLTARGTGTTLAGLTDLTLDVTGTGGTGGIGNYGFSGGTDGFAGGDGTGGSLAIEARTGAYVEIPTFVSLLSANGVGGDGGSGGDSYSGPGSSGGDAGDGFGGSLSLLAQGGTLVGGDIDLTSTGTGGAAGRGGYVYNGGSGSYYGPDGANGGGIGGLVSISALEGSPGVITLGATSIDASGLAGGGDVTIPTTGGSIVITDASTDPAGLITMGSLTAVSAGNFGTPGDFTMAGNSGPITVNGAVDVTVDGNIVFDFDGTGQLVAAGPTTLVAAGSITVNHGNNSEPTFSIDSTGAFTAIAGSDFTVASGAIVNSGGFVTIQAQGAIFVDDIRGVGSLDLFAGLDNTVNKASVTALSQFFATSVLGDVDLLDAVITSDLIQITAAGSLLGTASLISPNDIGITVGGDINASLIDTGGQLTTVAGIGGAFEPSYLVPGSINVGSLVQGGAVGLTIIAGGDIAFGSITTPNQAIVLEATSGDAYLGNTTAAGADSIDILAQSITADDIAANSSITLTSITGDIGFTNAAAGTDLVFTSNGAITGGGVAQAGNSASFSVGIGGIDLASLIAPVATLIAVDGPVRVTAATVDQLSAFGSDIFLRGTGSLALFATATAGNIDVRAAGDLTVDLADATGAITLAADGGNLTANFNPDSATIIGLSVNLSAAQDVVLDGDIFAQQALGIVAGGTISVQSLVSGTTISTLSADIDIGAGGILGDSTRTTDILIASDGSDTTTLGDGVTSTGFALSAAEIARIQSAGNLAFNALAPSSGGTGLVIGDLTVAVSSSASPGQIGVGGTLGFDTDGDALVAGALLVDGADTSNVLELTAGQILRIDARNGNLRLADGNGGATGQVLLTATDLLAVTDEALADISGLTIDQISDRLAQSDGVDRPDGVIQADALTISASASRVFIQNTALGTDFIERRGIVVGSLTLTDLAGTVMPIVINGIVAQAQGSDAIAATSIQASYDSRSTINGCLIASPTLCGAAIPGPVFPTDGIQDLIEEGIDSPGTLDELKADTVTIRLAEQEEFRDDPLIDEPVTGAGNDDFWTDDECADDAKSPGCTVQIEELDPAE